IVIPATVLDSLPVSAFQNGPGLWQPRYPRPSLEGQKYQRGRVLVVGGRLMTGAARLAAMACARVRAGLVTIAAPATVWPVYAGDMTSVMVHPLRESASLDEILSDGRVNAVVAGPGAGVSDLSRMHA